MVVARKDNCKAVYDIKSFLTKPYNQINPSKLFDVAFDASKCLCFPYRDVTQVQDERQSSEHPISSTMNAVKKTIMILLMSASIDASPVIARMLGIKIGQLLYECRCNPTVQLDPGQVCNSSNKDPSCQSLRESCICKDEHIYVNLAKRTECLQDILDEEEPDPSGSQASDDEVVQSFLEFNKPGGEKQFLDYVKGLADRMLDEDFDTVKSDNVKKYLGALLDAEQRDDYVPNDEVAEWEFSEVEKDDLLIASSVTGLEQNPRVSWKTSNLLSGEIGSRLELANAELDYVEQGSPQNDIDLEYSDGHALIASNVMVHEVESVFKQVYPELQDMQFTYGDQTSFKDAFSQALSKSNGKPVSGILKIKGKQYANGDGIVHMVNILGDPVAKKIYLFDSMASHFEDMRAAIKVPDGYSVHEMRSMRQFSDNNCLLASFQDARAAMRYGLKDLSSFAEATVIRGPDGDYNPILPAEFYESLESMSLLRKHEDLGALFESQVTSDKVSEARSQFASEIANDRRANNPIQNFFLLFDKVKQPSYGEKALATMHDFFKMKSDGSTTPNSAVSSKYMYESRADVEDGSPVAANRLLTINRHQVLAHLFHKYPLEPRP